MNDASDSPARDQFAQLVLSRIRDAGETAQVEYDAGEFRLIRADDSDLCFVALDFRDPAGTLVTNVEGVITAAVEGPGRLLAMGSSRPNTKANYLSGSHTSFDGRALAIIRPTGKGTITLSAKAEGFDSIEVSVRAD